MVTLAVDADRRFRRPSVQPRRRRSRRRVGVVVLKLGLVLALGGTVAWRTLEWVRATPLLRIARITVQGTAHLSTGEVMALVGDLRGQNILFVDLESWRTRLRGSPWVAEAALRRVLPSTIEVRVTERRPVGLARLATRLFLVDEAGVVIDEYGPQYRQFDLPIIDGLASAPQEGPGAIDPARAALAGRLLGAVEGRQDLKVRVSQLDVSDVRDVAVLLEGEGTWLHLGTERFAERVQTYLDLRPVLRERVPAAESVDLRFDRRVYVRPGRLMRPDAESRDSSARVPPF